MSMREHMLSGCVGGAVVLVGMLVLGAGKQPQPGAETGAPKAPVKGKADEVAFRDAEGNVRIAIVAEPDPAIFLADKRGNRLLTLAVVKDTPVVQLSSAYDGQGVMLQVEGRQGSYLHVRDAKKQDRIRIGGADTYFEMAVSDQAKRNSFIVSATDDAAPIMMLNDWRNGHQWWEPKLDHSTVGK